MDQNNRVLWSTLLLATFAVASPSEQQVLLSGTPVQFRNLKSRRGCQLAIPKLRRLCQSKYFSTGSAMEVAVEDFDNDGLEDVAVRFRSPLDCSSHGCQTQFYHAQRGTFVRMGYDARSDGPVVRCRNRSISGVAYTESGHNQVCMMFPGWTDKDLEPAKAVLFQGSRFSLLQGSALRAALLGHSFEDTPCNDTSQCIERFYENGRYAQSEDRGVLKGKYLFRRDRYCAGLENYQFCAAVYVSEDGRLARTNLKCGAPCITLIQGRRLPKGSSD